MRPELWIIATVCILAEFFGSTLSFTWAQISHDPLCKNARIVIEEPNHEGILVGDPRDKNIIYGTPGRDIINSGTGTSCIISGKGRDTIHYEDPPGDRLLINPGTEGGPDREADQIMCDEVGKQPKMINMGADDRHYPCS